jgi:DNA-binding transcriptional MerR regulator
MARKSARPAQSSRQKGRKPANSGSSVVAAPKALKIGEAARLLGVEAYVLRFWETQFPELRPYHTATRHRLYNPEDIETLRLIKHLLYEEGFTIEGARKRIKELAHTNSRSVKSPSPKSPAKGQLPHRDSTNHAAGSAAERQALIDIRRGLESIYQLLKD